MIAWCKTNCYPLSDDVDTWSGEVRCTLCEHPGKNGNVKIKQSFGAFSKEFHDEGTLAVRCVWMCGALSGQWLMTATFERVLSFSDTYFKTLWCVAHFIYSIAQ